MGGIYDRWDNEEPMVITHDPTKADTRPFHQVYGQRSRKPGLILSRAYALARQGRWERMKNYLHWELNQPTHGDPAMEQVRLLCQMVKHIDSIDQLASKHMLSACLRHQAGHTDLALARLGWLLELIPADHPKYAQAADLYLDLIDRSEHP